MASREHPETWEEKEERLLRLHEAAEAGCFDDIFDSLVDYVISQLPEGYMLDDESRLVRLDPDLPDHVYIASMVNGIPSGRVRVPVYTGEPVLSSTSGG